MMKFNFNKNEKTLSVQFEIPISKIASQYEAFQDFYKSITQGSDFKLHYNDKDDLVGLKVSLEGLFQLIDTNLQENMAQDQKMIIQKILDSNWKTDKEGLQVNFHQCMFDTPDRYWAFIFNQNHFFDYFINRLNWEMAPNREIVTPFPLHVDIETANTCNMNCPMCYRDQMKEVGQMAMDVFKKVLDECQHYGVYSVRLSWRGEPLTHPNIKEMIVYATERIKNVSFLTNAFFLDEEMVSFLVRSNLSYMAVSFDGIGEIYESIRHPAKFKENYQRLKRLKEKRGALKNQLPQVRLCTIWPAISKDPVAYYDTMKDVSDYIVYNPYINFKGSMTVKPDFICQYPWERVVIGFNGNAQCCTGWNAEDISLGNVQDKTIYDMWHGDALNKLRQTHAAGERMTLKACAECRHGSEGDKDIDIWDIVKRKH